MLTHHRAAGPQPNASAVPKAVGRDNAETTHPCRAVSTPAGSGRAWERRGQREWPCLHGDEAVVHLHLLGEEVCPNGRLVGVAELLVHVPAVWDGGWGRGMARQRMILTGPVQRQLGWCH
jgi:hypothetical protein